MCYVYILFSEKLNRYYIGQTRDIEERLRFHNNPIEARKFTARGIPWILKISIPCKSRTHALLVEQQLKKLKSRVWIERIITDSDFREQFLAQLVKAPDC